MSKIRRQPSAWLLLACSMVLFAACSPTTATVDETTVDESTVDAGPEPTPLPTPTADQPLMPDRSQPPAKEPVPYQPAGPVGTAAGYEALITEIEAELPASIHAEIPWPDLRNPDPAQAQIEIFDLWIWVIENHPDPAFARAMAAPESPSRQDTAGTFGDMLVDNELHIREASPYVAFDHRVVTFESSGLPLWLARDVPDDAVVVYYRDRSGPTTIRDRTTGEISGAYGGAGDRQWLSIMVPTDAGWMLFRDQLIERGDPELEVPALPDPATADPRADV